MVHCCESRCHLKTFRVETFYDEPDNNLAVPIICKYAMSHPLQSELSHSFIGKYFYQSSFYMGGRSKAGSFCTDKLQNVTRDALPYRTETDSWPVPWAIHLSKRTNSVEFYVQLEKLISSFRSEYTQPEVERSNILLILTEDKGSVSIHRRDLSWCCARHLAAVEAILYVLSIFLVLHEECKANVEIYCSARQYP